MVTLGFSTADRDGIDLQQPKHSAPIRTLAKLHYPSRKSTLDREGQATQRNEAKWSRGSSSNLTNPADSSIGIMQIHRIHCR